jgi:uncharacterized protein
MTRRPRLGDWTETYSGHQFWALDPDPEDVHIEDIAHALSQLCRFGGHCRDFYSVAQHAVLVSRIVPPTDALWGLLHDAAEAYVVDVPRPLKHLSQFKGYRAIERLVMITICHRFNLVSFIQPESVTKADDQALATEARDLMKQHYDWRLTATPLPDPIQPCPPAEAEQAFLARFKELWHAR